MRQKNKLRMEPVPGEMLRIESKGEWTRKKRKPGSVHYVIMPEFASLIAAFLYMGKIKRGQDLHDGEGSAFP